MKLRYGLEGYKIYALAGGYSAQTIMVYLSAMGTLIEFLGDKEIQEVTSDDLQKFKGYLVTDYVPVRINNPSNTEKLSTASHHRYWKAIRSFFKWAAEELNIPRPDLKLKMPSWESKEITPFSEEEINELIKGCDYAVVPAGVRKEYRIRKTAAIRNKAIILTLLDTGIRVGELTRLRVCDVNLENGEVYIKPHHVRKSHSRTTYIGKTTRKVLWRYLVTREGPQHDDMLFVSITDKPMTTHSVQAVMAKLGNSSGIKGVHPHRLRHTFAIQYLRNGGDVFTLKRLLGHKTFEMVNHYLNISSIDTQSAHKRASPVDRWHL